MESAFHAGRQWRREWDRSGFRRLSRLWSPRASSAQLQPAHAYTQVLWTWIDVAGFRPQIAFYLDSLSLTMVLVVTCVGFLIHIYAAEFMAEDGAFTRYFGYMNLFVASMITLLLADNLLLLMLGWEGVGLCSFLLVGFWYREPANGARRAQGVHPNPHRRYGNVSGALSSVHAARNAADSGSHAARFRAVAAGIRLCGCSGSLIVGRSGRQVGATSAAGLVAGRHGRPHPTSALLHAATMVTAGVYLIARTHVLFSPGAGGANRGGVVGAATLLLAGFSALTQHDIKRVLAYSTMSQIGYMFLALGVGAWQAAMFHFMTHAFFKALLFLGAGVIINALDDEHSMFRMGGLRKELPVAFWTFLIAGCSLAGLPFITAGFFSKDLIIWNAWSAPNGHPGFWIAGMAGALADFVVHIPADLPGFLRPTRQARDQAARLCHDSPARRAGFPFRRGRIFERADPWLSEFGFAADDRSPCGTA